MSDFHEIYGDKWLREKKIFPLLLAAPNGPTRECDWYARKPDAKASYQTPATYQPRSTKPRPTVHTKTGQPPKYGHSPPAQLSPAKPTTKSTKSKNMRNSTSFVFHIRPANKIYFLKTFDLYQIVTSNDTNPHEEPERYLIRESKKNLEEEI